MGLNHVNDKVPVRIVWICVCVTCVRGEFLCKMCLYVSDCVPHVVIGQPYCWETDWPLYCLVWRLCNYCSIKTQPSHVFISQSLIEVLLAVTMKGSLMRSRMLHGGSSGDQQNGSKETGKLWVRGHKKARVTLVYMCSNYVVSLFRAWKKFSRENKTTCGQKKKTKLNYASVNCVSRSYILSRLTKEDINMPFDL